MKPLELKQLIKEEVHSALNEEKKYLNDMSYEELIAHRKRMDFKKASREEKKYVKDLIDKKKPLDEEYDPNQDPENKGSEAYKRKSWKAQFGSMDGFDKAHPEYSKRYTDKEMLQRTTANQLPDNFTILDIIERYKEYVVGHLRSEGELNENKLIKEEYDFKTMSDDLASKEMVRQELMDMRVNILRIMKSLKNYGYSKEEVLAFFDNERDNKIKSTFF